jgi:hypothetical protein
LLLNSVQIEGRIITAPALYSAGSTPICRFRIMQLLVPQGAKQNQSFEVEQYGPAAEETAQGLSMDDDILILGRLVRRVWNDRTTGILCQDVRLHADRIFVSLTAKIQAVGAVNKQHALIDAAMGRDRNAALSQNENLREA